MLPDAEAVAAALQLDANEPGKSTATAVCLIAKSEPNWGLPPSLYVKWRLQTDLLPTH